MGYKFEIIYKPEKENVVANALSRKEVMEFKAVSLWQYDDINNLEKEIQKDAVQHCAANYCQQQPTSWFLYQKWMFTLCWQVGFVQII